MMAGTFRLQFKLHLTVHDDQFQFAYLVSSVEVLPALRMEATEVVHGLRLPWSLERCCPLPRLPSDSMRR